MLSLLSAFLACGFLNVAAGTFFPPPLEGITSIQSKFDSEVTISYRETNICETTPGVKSYSGYVHLPASEAELRPYPVNTFFWFFESRKDPENAPLSLWLQGGPGVPSITAAIGENGPCSVTENSKDTILNPWSWNNEVNMLYIDQPVQVGFSYDSLVNGTLNQLEGPTAVRVADFSNSGPPEVNNTFLIGTFPSGNTTRTANTTAIASLAMWHFLQTFTQEYPVYKPKENKLSIWTESYGGHFGPSFSEFFENQNDLIASGQLPSATPLHLDTLGIINGCVDILTQMPAYPQFAYNNTYGLQVLSEEEFSLAVQAFPKCEKLVETCRQLVASEDPNNRGTSTDANTACDGAFTTCFGTMWNAYNKHERDVFDITQPSINSFPPKWAAGYLNSGTVQSSLGVPLNWTGQSNAVNDAFTESGDFVRSGNLENIGRLLNRGVKVALVYGDRDYQCNWLGGEALSLAVNSTSSSGFKAAGYTNLQTSSTYIGGLVRQFGNFSFTRVFQAGHAVPYYQPETAYRIFQRAMFNTDIATGEIPRANNISTTGPHSVFGIKNEPAAAVPQICYLWDVKHTCTQMQKQILTEGTGVVRDFILVGYKSNNGSQVWFDISFELGIGSNSTVLGAGAPKIASPSPKNVVTSSAPIIFTSLPWFTLGMTLIAGY